jgi:hypothetical protein
MHNRVSTNTRQNTPQTNKILQSTKMLVQAEVPNQKENGTFEHNLWWDANDVPMIPKRFDR